MIELMAMTNDDDDREVGQGTIRLTSFPRTNCISNEGLVRVAGISIG